ncbi:MAG: flavin reductase family protein [Lachnospiraceae bacterium]|nr:flavin reductase family protein [Lachnospiraceae bacterium]
MARQFWKPGNMLYPLPAVMVSCKRKDERPNIITVAWAGTICTNPAMLSISVRPERYSYDIIRESKEFVVNLVTEELIFAADYCGVKSGRDVDKFKELKLDEADSLKVSTPGIEQSPVNIECKVREIKELGSHHMFIAEVVSVNIEEQYLDSAGKFNLNQSGLAVYSHGEYFGLGRKCGSFGYSVRKHKKVNKNTKHKNKKDN